MQSSALASVLIAVIVAAAMVYDPSEDAAVPPVAVKPIIQNITIGVLPGFESSLPSYKFLSRLAEEDVNAYCIEKGLNYRFRFNISDALGTTPDALTFTKEFLASGVKIVLGYPWSSHFCSGARVYGYNKTMVLMSPTASSSIYSIGNDTLYRLCPSDFELTEVTLRAMSTRGIKAVVALNVFSNYEANFQYLIDERFTSLGIERFVAVATPALTDDFPVLDIDLFLNRAEKAVTETVAIYGENATAILIIPEDEPDRIAEVVEAAGSRPVLSSVSWYGMGEIPNQYYYASIANDTAARLGMTSAVESFKPTSTYERVKELWLASADSPEGVTDLGYYNANIYDGLWVLSLSVIEANSTEPLTLMSVIPSVASGFVGATGRCTLDEYGDRLGMDYDFYKYLVVDGETKSVKIGSYSWEADEYTWSDLK